MSGVQSKHVGLRLTPFVLVRTPTDIFPAINIPVVSIVWSYTKKAL